MSVDCEGVMVMKNFRIALIGVGGRGEGLYRVSLKQREYVHIVAVCDEYADRCEYVSNELQEDGRPAPKQYSDYRKCIDENELDAVVVATAWEAHIKVSRDRIWRFVPCILRLFQIDQLVVCGGCAN